MQPDATYTPAERRALHNTPAKTATKTKAASSPTPTGTKSAPGKTYRHGLRLIRGGLWGTDTPSDQTTSARRDTTARRQGGTNRG